MSQLISGNYSYVPDWNNMSYEETVYYVYGVDIDNYEQDNRKT